MNEYDLIRGLFGRDVPDLFASDAQFFETGGGEWGVTCDTFTPEDDGFDPADARLLGANVVRGTLSDLAASGCDAAFFLQAATFPRGASAAWCESYARGVREALAEAGCRLLGGDTGEADAPSFTGIALGPRRRALSRRLPPGPHRLWTTGPFGAFNAAAAAGRPAPAIPLRRPPPCADACIDTSGGFADAAWLLHAENPGFDFDLRGVPVVPPGDPALLFGGAGEYELLFAAPPDAPAPPGCLPVGEARPARGEGRVALDGVPLDAPPPDPRAFPDRAAYVAAVLSATRRFAKSNPRAKSAESPDGRAPSRPAPAAP